MDGGDYIEKDLLKMYKIEDIVPKFNKAYPIVIKGGAGYGPFIPFFSLDKDFPRDDLGVPYWTIDTQENIYIPYFYQAPFNTNACYVVLYLPIPKMMEYIKAKKLANMGVYPASIHSSSYNISYDTYSDNAKSNGRPIIGYDSVAVSSVSRSDKSVENFNFTYTYSQAITHIMNNQSKFYDSKEITIYTSLEAYKLFEAFYYKTFELACNSSLYYKSNQITTLPTPFSIPQELLLESLLVLYIQNYVYTTQPGGCIADNFARVGMGQPMRFLSASPNGDKQMYILGPKVPKYISFQAGGSHSTSRYDLSNPPTYESFTGDILKFPNSVPYGNTTGSIATNYPELNLNSNDLSSLYYIRKNSNILTNVNTHLNFSDSNNLKFNEANSNLVTKRQLDSQISLDLVRRYYIYDQLKP